MAGLPQGHRHSSKDYCITAHTPLSDKAHAHILLPSAKPAQSCGPLSHAYCSEQHGSHWQSADQNPQWRGHPIAHTQSDWTCLKHPSRPGLPGTTHPPRNPPRIPPGPGPSRPGRLPQRISSLGPGPTLSRCPPQGKHRHDGHGCRLEAL